MDRAELARVNRFAAVESLIVLVSHAAVKRLKMIVQRRQRHRHHACGRSAPCSQLTLRTLLARSLSPTAQQSRSQAVSIPRIFWGGGTGNPPQKKLTIPPPSPNSCQIVFWIFFSAGTVNYKYIAETFFWWTTNTENYSSFSNQKECKFMPKMHQNTFGGVAVPGLESW